MSRGKPLPLPPDSNLSPFTLNSSIIHLLRERAEARCFLLASARSSLSSKLPLKAQRDVGGGTACVVWFLLICSFCTATLTRPTECLDFTRLL